MFGTFKSIPLENTDFCIVEPPAGLLKHINSRLKLYQVEDGKSELTDALWASIFLLACMHEYDRDTQKVGKPLITSFANTVVANYTPTIREFYVDALEDVFKSIVEEFTFNATREQLSVWLDVLNDASFITKKKQDEEKNG
jgi:hypothetical protein